MPRERLTISLSNILMAEVEDLVTTSQYSTVSEYIRELIRRDLRERSERIRSFIAANNRPRIESQRTQNYHLSTRR